MAGGQAVEGDGVKRGTVFFVPPEMLTYDVSPEHALYEQDRARVETVDEELVRSFMAVGVKDPIQITVEGEGDDRSYVVVDGRRRAVNAIEANKRLKKLDETQIVVPVILAKGDENKLSEIMIALNELKKGHPVLIKAEKAQRFMDRVKDQNACARAFGVEPQTIGIWLKIASLHPKVKKLVEKDVLTPTAAAKFASYPPAEQFEAAQKFVEEAVAHGAKPSAQLAAATVRGRKKGTSADQAGAGPSKRVLRILLDREELRDKVDPTVIKTIKWLFGELEAKAIGGLTGVLNAIDEERREKAKAKAERKKKRETNKAKRAEKAKHTNGAAAQA